MADRFIGMFRDMELAERAAGNDHFGAGFLYLRPSPLTQCGRLFRQPRSHSSAGSATYCRHLNDVRHLPEQDPRLLRDLLSPGQVTRVVIGNDQVQVRRNLGPNFSSTSEKSITVKGVV